jgi:hypothetical protein
MLKFTTSHGGAAISVSWKGLPMFTPEQFRTKAAEYSQLVKTANSQSEARELQELERSFAVLADNEQWLRDNHDKTVHPTGAEALNPLTTQLAQLGPIQSRAPSADDQKSDVTSS